MCALQRARVNHVGPHLPRHRRGRPRHPPLHRPPLCRHRSPPHPPRQMTPNQAPQRHLSSSRRRKQRSRRLVPSAEQCRKPRRRPRLRQRCGWSSSDCLGLVICNTCSDRGKTDRLHCGKRSFSRSCGTCLRIVQNIVPNPSCLACGPSGRQAVL